MFGIFAVVLVTLLWLLRNIWAGFYASEQEIKDELIDVLPYFILGCLVFDGF
jgi:Na+-driven multidrug efflux pump